MFPHGFALRWVTASFNVSATTVSCKVTSPVNQVLLSLLLSAVKRNDPELISHICCRGSVARSYPALCDPMAYSPPGSSVHGVLQARVLEWVDSPSSRESSQPRDGTQVSHISWGFFTVWATREALVRIEALYSWWWHFKGTIPRFLRKTFWVYKTCWKLFKRFTSQRDPERIYSYNFFKVQFLRKERSRLSELQSS